MIKCKLSELMGREKMNIQSVSEATGLNRNTVSALYHEKAKRIDYDTIGKLCKLFHCNVGDLFDYTGD